MRHRIAICFALAALVTSLGCAGSRRCWISEAEAPKDTLISRLDPARGEVLRLTGVYLGGFEKGRIAPVELFDYEKSLPMGIEYCVRVSDECWGVLEREHEQRDLDEEWSLVVDAVVEFQGPPGPIECVGWVRILRMIEVFPRDRFTGSNGRAEAAKLVDEFRADA